MSAIIPGARFKRPKDYKIVFSQKDRKCSVCGDTINTGDPCKLFKIGEGRSHACTLCDVAECKVEVPK